MSKIEWCDLSSNPLKVRRKSDHKKGWGCRKISPGCANCYAATFNRRDLPHAGTGLDYLAESVEKIEPIFDRAALEDRRLRKPRRVFVGSMTDLAWSLYPEYLVHRVFDAYDHLARRVGHQLLVLTKRPERLLELVESYVLKRGLMDTHWWFGFSAEDQKRFDERWSVMEELRAFVDGPLWCSYEPALEQVDFTSALLDEPYVSLDWLVVGGESGGGARSFFLDWAMVAIEQCAYAGVPIFVKQVGSRPFMGPSLASRVGDAPCKWTFQGTWKHNHRLYPKSRKGGEPSEWPEALRIRQFPEVPRG